MNIAYYSHYFSPEIGAPSARISGLSRQWIASGHAVQVVTCFPNHPAGELYPGYASQSYTHEVMHGISVHRHWTYVTPNRGILKRTIGHISYLPAALLFSNPRMGPVDVAIGTSPTFFAAMAAAALGRRRRVPFIMEVRDLWPALFVDLGVLRNRTMIGWLERLEMALYREATRVVTVTESFRANIIARGIPADKVVTIPNGADVDFWNPDMRADGRRAELGLDGRFVVLYLGNHGTSQRLQQVVDASARLRDRAEIQFVLVGEGPEKSDLQRRVAQDGATNIRFLDPVDKRAASELYALADVCLVPLRDVPLFDTFIPSKMFEIMAVGRPIVASVRGESAEILRRSGAATVVAPEDAAGIADTIRTLADDRPRLVAMGAAGRRFVVDHYSRRSLAATYERVMTDAIRVYRHA